ncbi:MAG: DUF1599 domain-containing protein [Bacteroidia bacterium]|nr:DUF1599 domain-containing protein [Bacteroidia bacterium]
MSNNTSAQYDNALAQCRDIFEKKTFDYGTAWRILRPESLTDQIFIKAKRIRSIEESKQNLVGESLENEYIGIFNYCVMALIQLKHNTDPETDLEGEVVMKWYDTTTQETKDLMMKKNHDYGEAWRDMRVSTFTDLILMKLLRIRQIEDNEGKTLVSEGLDANFQDMMNYAIFALIRKDEFA